MAGKGLELGKERLLFHHLINISQEHYEEQMADAVSNDRYRVPKLLTQVQPLI